VANPQALIIGQMLAAGSASQNDPRLLTAKDGADAALLFGEGSVVHRAAIAWKANNKSFHDLYAIGVDDASGTKASGTVTFTSAAATESGTLSLYIGNDRVQVSVTSGDAGSTVTAPALATAINNADNLPVTASETGGVVTITHRHVGTIGNQVRIQLNFLGDEAGEATPAGLNITLSGSNLASGATDPTITSAIAAMADTEYDVVVFAFPDATARTALAAEIADRWTDSRQVYGHMFMGSEGSVGTLSGLAFNAEEITNWGYNDSPTPAFEWGAAHAAVFGAVMANDPGAPAQFREVKHVIRPRPSSQFTKDERDTLLNAGVATSVASGNSVVIERGITSYTTNAAGLVDESWLDAQTRYTLMYVVRDMRSRIVSKYGSHKLANDGTRFAAGQKVVTPKVVRAELISRYRFLESIGLVENAALFAQNLVVERNGSNPNRLDVLYPPDLINQLRIFAVYREIPRVPEISGDFLNDSGLKLADLRAIAEATVQVELVDGSVYVLRDAWVADAMELDASEGTVSVRFQGMSGSEIK